jgi:hypothetical protein
MIRIIIFFLGIITLAVSCTDKKVSRTDLAFNKVIAGDLVTNFPGTLEVSSKYFLLENPFNNDAFLQVYDRQTGEVVLNTGTTGRGPGEWNTPSISNVINDRIAVYDENLKQFTLTEVDTVMLNISNPDSAQKISANPYKFVFLNEYQYIAATWEETHPFQFFSYGQSVSCGQYPIREPVKNTFDRFQGTIQVQPQKKILVYATFHNPYIALYQIGKDSLSLLWENQFKPAQYSIAEGQLRWGTNQPCGVSDVAFTKDYIVCMVNELNLNEVRGREIETTPKTVYVFDYDGQLVHIFDLPVHSLRLAADGKTNVFYSVALEPDYSIVEYDLSSQGM